MSYPKHVLDNDEERCVGVHLKHYQETVHVSQTSHSVVRTSLQFSGHWPFQSVLSLLGVILCLLLRAALGSWGPHSVLLTYIEMEGTWENLLNSLFSSSAQDMLAWHIFCQAKILFFKDFASYTQGEKTQIVGSCSLTPVAGPQVQWRGCCQRLPASCFLRPPYRSYTPSHTLSIHSLLV